MIDLSTGPSVVQNFKVVAISPTSVVISWNEPLEAKAVIDGYEVELRQYTQKSVGTVEAVPLHKFVPKVQERSIFIDSLSEC